MENISDASKIPLKLKDEINTDFYLKDFSNQIDFDIKNYIVGVRGESYYKILDKITWTDNSTKYLVVNIEDKNITYINPTSIVDIGIINNNGLFSSILI